MDHSGLFMRLSQSKFRSSFYLKEKDKKYAAEKGRELTEEEQKYVIVPGMEDIGHFIFLYLSVTFFKPVRLISEKGGKKKTDEHRGTLPDIF